MEDEAKAPGLTWMARPKGRVPYWVATKKAVRDGFPIKTANLSHLADNPAALVERCHRLQAEMTAWFSPAAKDGSGYDGTLRSVLRLYETHPDSTYHQLKFKSRQLYDGYLPLLAASIGGREVATVTGLDVMRWFKVWREPTEEGGPEHLAKARVILAVLKAAVTFATVSGHAGCAPLQNMIALQKFEKPAPRDAVVTAEMVDRIRAAAHAAGFPSIALASAIQFETSARQWDVVGQWLPLSEPGTSSVLYRGRKWIGPHWSSIDADLVLRTTPTKTERTTAKRVEVDLTMCPMVMDELALIPAAKRTGPLIINERTGFPYRGNCFAQRWRRLARSVGVPDDVWNRDTRAGAVTEGRQAGVATDDLARVAGHTGKATTARVYDRDTLEAHRRSASQRSAFRTKAKTAV